MKKMTVLIAVLCLGIASSLFAAQTAAGNRSVTSTASAKKAPAEAFSATTPNTDELRRRMEQRSSSATSSKSSSKSLKDAAKGHFQMGVALPSRAISNKDTSAIAAKQFNRVVAENEMKWDTIEPQEGKFNFGPGDKLVEFARKNGMAVHGHVLVWHSQTPQWVFQGENGQPCTRELLLKRMKNHINAVLAHYKGKVATWDVVNEAFEDNGQLRNSQWRSIIGDDFIKIAFQYAREADPNITLIYNDYSMPNNAKRAGILKYIKEANKGKKVIDGIGLQGHWDLNYPDVNQAEKTITECAGTGLHLFISELDLNTNRGFRNSGRGLERVEGANDANISDMNRALRDRYAEIFKIFVKYQDSIDAVTVWGIADNYSWIRGEPLLYDKDLKEKPAVKAIIDVLDKAPAAKKSTLRKSTSSLLSGK